MLWILRKRRVLFAIFLLALVYFLVATFGTKRGLVEEDVSSKLEVNLFELIDSEDDETSNSDGRSICKNSVQGKLLIADDRGRVCDRADLSPADGCCRHDAPSTRRHVCLDCVPDASGCCAVYEHCVSCCMRPESAAVLRHGLDGRLQPAASAAAAALGLGGGAGNGTTGGGGGSSNVNKVYGLVGSRFDLCLTLCRTSSLSVRHENAYADAARKHCFGGADAATADDV